MGCMLGKDGCVECGCVCWVRVCMLSVGVGVKCGCVVMLGCVIILGVGV